MNQKVIEVELTSSGDADVLIFRLDDDKPEEYVVDLNSSTGQTMIKHVFSKLLNVLVTEDIRLNLTINKDYKKGLYKDVCAEYISDLNRELVQVKEEMKRELA